MTSALPTCSRQTFGFGFTSCARACRGLRITNPRYGRVQLCATEGRQTSTRHLAGRSFSHASSHYAGKMPAARQTENQKFLVDNIPTGLYCRPVNEFDCGQTIGKYAAKNPSSRLRGILQ